MINIDKSNSCLSRRSVDRMIRVNHAGEYGARRIYEGQVVILGRKKSFGTILRKMLKTEKDHLALFQEIMVIRRVRPTSLIFLWHGVGYTIGLITAFLGERAAMSCTAAIEEVINKHFLDQEKKIKNHGTDQKLDVLKKKINFCRLDEQEHLEIALKMGAEEVVGYLVLRKVLQIGSIIAIQLSQRI